MIPPILIFKFSPSPDAPEWRVRRHAQIETATNYLFLCGLFLGAVLLFVRIFSGWAFISASSYILLIFLLTRMIAARSLLGRHVRPPRILALAMGEGPPLSAAMSVLTIGALVIGVVMGSFGFLFVFALLVTGHFGPLAACVLVTMFGAGLVFGSAKRLYRRWIAPRLGTKRAGNPLEISQGLIAKKILVDEAALQSADPYDVVMAVINFVNWAMQDALLLPEEFPREAMYAYHVDYYVAQVNNGGHAQFATNSQMLQKTIANIENGLAAFGTDDARAIFGDFLIVMRDSSEAFNLDDARQTFEKINEQPQIETLDDRFFAANVGDDLIRNNVVWLRRLPQFRALSPARLAAEKAALKANNRLLGARQAKLAELKSSREAADPKFVVAKRLCQAAGLIFKGLTAGQLSSNEPYAMIWGVRTVQGVRLMHLTPTVANLFDQDAKSIVASLALPLT
jgi:hypothetical protein